MKIKLPMTSQEYTDLVGTAPIEDNLDLVNCKLQGQKGHLFCGWNACKDLPMFMGWEHSDDCDTNSKVCLHQKPGELAE